MRNSYRAWVTFGAQNHVTRTMCHFVCTVRWCVFERERQRERETEGHVSAQKGGAQCCKAEGAVLR